MGQEMVIGSYSNPVRLMPCLSYQSLSLLCKTNNSKDVLCRVCFISFDRRVDVLGDVAVMSLVWGFMNRVWQSKVLF